MKDLGKILREASDEYIKSHPSKNDEILEYFSIHQERFRNLLEAICLDGQKEGFKQKILDVGCYPPHFRHRPFKIGL